MNNTFIQLSRKILTWEWYQNSNVLRVFIHCLLKANHQDNKWQGKVIRRGSLATSYDNIGESLKLSKQEVRTAIKKLKSTGEIVTNVTPKYLLVSIVKYDDYQYSSNKTNTQLTLKQHSTNTQVTPNNNDNNDNNDNIININNAMDRCLENKTWTEAVKKNYLLTDESFDQYIKAFTLHATLQGKLTISTSGYMQYFVAWYKKTTGKGMGGKKIIRYKKPTL